MAEDLPTPVHHFSYETRVSLELPRGWIEDDDGEQFVIYAPFEPDDEDLTVPPRFIVKVLEVLLPDPEGYLQLAQQLIETPMKDRETLAHEALTVDGFDGMMDVFNYHEESVQQLVTQCQVFVQVGQVVFSLTGMVEAAHREAHLPVFQSAIESVRFIIPWSEGE